MKHKQRWAGAICCFVLFIVVCLFLATHMKGAFRAAGHPEIGLLFSFFLVQLPASFHIVEVLKPLFGAMLAAPCSMLIMRLFFTDALILARAGMVIKCGVLVCAGGIVFLIYQ